MNSRGIYVLLYTILYVSSRFGRGFENGPSTKACCNLTPGHLNTTPQTTPCPYMLNITATTYTPGKTITVKLRSHKERPFIGFILQARLANPKGDVTTLVSYFNNNYPHLSQYINCGTNTPDDIGTFGQGTVGHISKVAKTYVSFNWYPPVTAVGHIVFRCTFLETPSVYWVAVNSHIVRDSSLTGPLNFTEAEVAAQDPCPRDTSTTTTTKAPVLLSRRPECYKTHGCFDNCDANGHNCDSTLMWRKKGNITEIELRAKIFDEDYWMAFGISRNHLMPDVNVLECVRFQSQADSFFSYNEPYGHMNTRDLKKNFEKATELSYLHGIFRCLMTYKHNKYMYKNNWYIMLPNGHANQYGEILKHDIVYLSATTVNLTDIATRVNISTGSTNHTLPPPLTVPTVPTVHTVPTPHQVTTPSITVMTTDPGSRWKLTRDPRCNKQLGCLDDCNALGVMCSVLAAWNYTANDTYRFHLASLHSTGDAWVALGFSQNKQMGATIVAECVRFVNGVDVFNSHNIGDTNVRTKKASSLTLVDSSYKNGIFRCTMDIVSHDTSDLVDLNKGWYFILAHGEARSDGGILKHTSEPIVSPKPIIIRDKPAPKSNYIARIHGSIMLVAWVFTSTIGMFIVRYYQQVWVKSTIHRDPTWFMIHRTCMVLTFFLTIISIVIIFVDVNGFTQIGEQSTLVASHPFLGLIVLGLVVINPLMALARCSNESPKRWVFVWLHRSVGVIASALAHITIFTSFYIDRARIDPNIFIVAYAYVVYQIATIILHEVAYRFPRKTADHCEYTLNIQKKDEVLYENLQMDKWVSLGGQPRGTADQDVRTGSDPVIRPSHCIYLPGSSHHTGVYSHEPYHPTQMCRGTRTMHLGVHIIITAAFAAAFNMFIWKDDGVYSV